MRALRSAWPWLGGGLALTLAGAWNVSTNVSQFDESWMLQVARRVADGETLYDDVHFGATPLSVYVLSGVVEIVGAQILAVKALSVLLFAGSALLVGRIALQGGVSGFGAVVCVALTIPLAPAFADSLYTPLAMLLFLACETIAFTACRHPGLGRAAAAGSVAGLAFAAKQNVGGLALLALTAVILFAEPTRAAARRAVAAVAAFSAAAAATVAAMIATGGAREALDALGLGKGAYLELGAVPYLPALRGALTTLSRPDTWGDEVAWRELAASTSRTLFPVLTALLLVAAWVGRARSRRSQEGRDLALITVTVFAFAGFVSAFPRYDVLHLGWIGGPLLAACAVSLSRLFPTRRTALRLLAASLAAAWAVFAVLGPVDKFRSGTQVRVALPHFAGAWTSEDERARAVDAVRRLQAAVPERRVFLAMGNASFFYLAAELENPTPHDYPASTSIGQRQADEIVRDVLEGSLPSVCLVDAPPRPHDLRLPELERRLRRLLSPGPDVGPCRLWRRADAEGT